MKTMPRLKGFDYRRPFFYMVTLKRRATLSAFSQIEERADPPKDANGRPRYLIANEITRAFACVIREFAGKWRGIAPIECFIVMPDHIHLLIKIEDTSDQLPLGSYVHQLMRALAREYWAVCGATGCPAQHSDEGVAPPQRADGNAPPQEAAHNTLIRNGRIVSDKSIVLPAPSGNNPAPSPSIAPVFQRDWHEWIVKKDGQLAAFTRYIRENPYRAWLRRQHRHFFGKVRKVVDGRVTDTIEYMTADEEDN